MDPLVVAGAVGELLDHRLVDDDPARQAEFLARHLHQLPKVAALSMHCPPPGSFPRTETLVTNLDGRRR